MAVQQNPHRTENDLADTTHRAYTIVYSASPHPDGHLGFFLPFISVSTALSNCELSCFTLTVMSVHSRFPEVRLAASGGPWTQPHSLCNDWMVLPSLLQLWKLTIPASLRGCVVQILILTSCLKHGASVSSHVNLFYIHAEACVKRWEDNFSRVVSFFPLCRTQGNNSGPEAWVPVSASWVLG